MFALPMAVHVEQEGRVATLTIDNPPRQLQDRELNSKLYAVLKQLERDRSVGAIVVTGAHPRSFVTHYDVTEILAGAQVTPDLPPSAFAAALRIAAAIDRLPGVRRVLEHRRTIGLADLWRTQKLYLRMNHMAKAFVAAINGTAAAGGCELALACDIRLMADGDFTIGLTEPALGFNPGGGGGQRLARAVGSARAIEMLLEARHYTPHAAVEAGLIHHVVPAENLLDEAKETAARLARRSPRAVWASKRAVYKGQSARWPHGFRLDQSGFAWGAVAPSTKRAMRVMLEQMSTLPDEVPSPWHDPHLLRTWQEGTAADFAE
jgi:enoyl-CoA hydratase/carnithine racemase